MIKGETWMKSKWFSELFVYKVRRNYYPFMKVFITKFLNSRTLWTHDFWKYSITPWTSMYYICSWRDRLIVLWTLNRQTNIFTYISAYLVHHFQSCYIVLCDEFLGVWSVIKTFFGFFEVPIAANLKWQKKM